MTIPPGSAPMTPPTGAQLSALPPPSTPPVYATMPVAPPPTVAEAVASGETPVAMVLDVPGARAGLVVAYGLLTTSPKVALDGVKAKKAMFGAHKVPMLHGSDTEVRIKASRPGYPTIKVNQSVVYRAPKPGALNSFAYFIAALGGGLLGLGFGGYLVGGVAAFGAGYGASVWLRQPGPVGVRYAVLIAGGVVGVVLGAGAFIAFRTILA